MKILTINNMKVVYHYLPSKLTNIQFLVNVGSSSESKEERGYCHILEHTHFNGSSKYPNPLDIQTAANDIGGNLNAWSWNDACCYHITTLNEFFRAGFDILADMIQNPLFPEEEFNKELNPILSEMRRYEDEPSSYLANRLIPMIVGDEAGHSTIGNEETIKSATADKIKEFRKKYYGTNTIMISVVGGVSEQDVISIVSDLMEWKCVAEIAKTPKVEYKNGELVLYKEGVSEAIYNLCYPAFGRFHPNRYKQKLMAFVLGGNDSGMLYERIRGELGLGCYGIYASQVNFDAYSLLDISTGIDPTQIDQCHDEVMKQINKLTTEKVSDKRLARAKASLRTSVAAASENSGGYNNSISLAIMKGYTEDPLEKLLVEIESTTADDIISIAQETFSAQPYKGVLLPEINE